MERQDKDLAFMLQYENIAWYENGEVRILDRRIYPAKTAYVRCKDYRAVIAALRDMVTQSAGPYTAAAAGMALAAHQCREQTQGSADVSDDDCGYTGRDQKKRKAGRSYVRRREMLQESQANHK